MEINLRVVNSPSYSAKPDAMRVYESIAKDYFSVERIVKIGDIIAIPSHLNSNYYQIIDDSNCLDWPTIFFLVANLNPFTNASGDVYRTTPMIQVYIHGFVNHSIPYKAEEYFTPKHSLPASENYFNLLLECILPYFTHLKSKIGTILLSGPPGCGKRLACKKIAGELNVNFCPIQCHALLTDSPLTTSKSIKAELSRAASNSPCIVFLESIHLFCLEKEEKYILECLSSCLVEAQKTRDASYGFVLVGSTSQQDLDTSLASIFLHQVQLEPPDLEYRTTLLKSLTGQFENRKKIVDEISQSTQGLSLNQLIWIMSPPIESVHSSADPDLEVYINRLKSLNKSLAKLVQAPTVPNVEWSDVGGLTEAKKEILDCIQRPLDHKELADSSLRRCGFLLHGPPGTGKTMLAKAVASNFSSHFLSVKGPELISAYVGQSEENIRNVFKKAIDMRPTIIFFDELDSLAPRRGNYGDSGGVMDRIVSQLACEMDLISKYPDIYVFGATNRPDLIDSALLRPGRFERWIFVGPPTTAEERLNVLKALTRKFHLDKDLDLAQVEKSLPSGLTGADFYSICSSAMISALQRCITDIKDGKVDEESANLHITFKDFNLEA